MDLLKKFRSKLWLLFVPVVAVFIIILLNNKGIGMSPDAISYVSAARSLQEGYGFLRFYRGGWSFMVHFPPIFSYLLAAFDLSNINVITILQTIIGFLNVLLIGILGYFAFKGSAKFTVLLQVLVLFSIPILYVHSYIWSEPLFILLLYTIILLIYKRKSTIVTVALLSILPLVRYVGLFIFPLFILNNFFENKGKSIYARLRESAVYSLILMLPYVLWQIVAKTYGIGARKLSFHMFSLSNLKELFVTTWSWLFPLFEENICIAAPIISIVVGLYLYWFYVKSSKDRLSYLMQFVIVSYLGFLVVSISLFDAATPLDNRILAVIFPAVSLLVLGYFYENRYNRALNIVLLLIIVQAVIAGSKYLYTIYIEGTQYSTYNFQQSETIGYACNNLKNAKVVSNSWEALYSACGIKAHSLPFKINTKGDSLSQYDLLMKNLKEDTYIVYFDGKFGTDRRYPSVTDISKYFDLVEVNTLKDGNVYVLRKK